MPRPYPREFRDDVVRVARNREDGVTIEQIATDFGIHPMTLTKWMCQAAIDDGDRRGKSTMDSVELRKLRRRNRLLEQENEVLRRAAAYLPSWAIWLSALNFRPLASIFRAGGVRGR